MPTKQSTTKTRMSLACRVESSHCAAAQLPIKIVQLGSHIEELDTPDIPDAPETLDVAKCFYLHMAPGKHNHE